jgi:hypothetical protein
MTDGTAGTDSNHTVGQDTAGQDTAGSAPATRRGIDRSSKVMAAVVGLALAGVLAAAGFLVTTALLGPRAGL